jgi:hypothetical protein
MSIETALEKIKEEWDKLDDFPEVDIGIPDNALDEKYPALYLEFSEENFEYGTLHAVGDPTSTIASFTALLVIHKDNVDEGQSLLKDITNKVKSLRESIQTGNDPGADGVFKNDGDQGFRAQVQNVRYQVRPEDTKAAAALLIEVSQYV